MRAPIRSLVNRLLGPLGLVITNKGIVFELVAQVAAYHQLIGDLLEDGQVAVYDRETHCITIHTVQ